MARDLHEDSYYVSHGGQIPVKWTAPEVLCIDLGQMSYEEGICMCLFRLCTTRSTLQPVMCGVLDVSCMRYGVSDINHLKDTPTLRYDHRPLVTMAAHSLCV